MSDSVAANTVNNAHTGNDKRFHNEAYESDFINRHYKRLNILYQGLRYDNLAKYQPQRIVD